jgi:molybdopterin-guanine dinucleotide biosynthesis protein A
LPLVAHAIRAVAAVALEIVVALPADLRAPEPSLPKLPGTVSVRFVRDAEPDGGPLVGLDAALHAVTADRVIVVGGDMPRLRPAVFEAMLDRLDHPDRLDQPAAVVEAVVLGERGAARPLPAALRAGPARDAVTLALAAGERSLRAMLARLVTAELDAAVLNRLDPDAETLIDVDEPNDLERLRRSDRA